MAERPIEGAGVRATELRLLGSFFELSMAVSDKRLRKVPRWAREESRPLSGPAQNGRAPVPRFLHIFLSGSRTGVSSPEGCPFPRLVERTLLNLDDFSMDS